MILSIWSNIGNKITEFANSVKDFFLENSRSPFLWVGILIVGLIIFEYVYRKLSGD